MADGCSEMNKTKAADRAQGQLRGNLTLLSVLARTVSTAGMVIYMAISEELTGTCYYRIRDLAYRNRKNRNISKECLVSYWLLTM